MDAKHQFKYTYNGGCEDFSPVEVTFDIPGDSSLNQMLYNFQSYLKACGFVFDGELEIVDHTFDVMDELDGTLYEFDKDILDDSEGSDEDEWDRICSETEERAAKKLKEWNEGLSKLEKEVKKNNWVHGICNPPSPDWKKNKEHYDGAA